jgi:hypothetical protein
MSFLQDALRELAEARRQHGIARGRAEEQRRRLESLAEFRDVLEANEQMSDTSVAVGAAESKVRALALAEHALSGDYKPAEGVQIKEFSQVVYAPNLALDWCLAHATKYLQLDSKAFEKAAPVLRDLGAPVEMTKEARAQIATDLSAWLTNEGEAHGN